MATPFFRGNYGSALSRVDTRPIIEAGRARGQMFAGLGKELGGMIKEYGLNKEKVRVLTDSIEGTLDLYPEYAVRLTSSGDETSDKKNQTTLDKLAKGELGLAGLEGLAGKLALMEKKDEKERKLQLEDLNRKLTEDNLKFKRDALQREEDLRNAVKTQAKQSLGLIEEAKEARQQKMESGVPFKPTLEVERLFAQEDNLKLASETGDVRFLPKPTDPMVSKAAEQNLAKNALEILRLNNELNNSTDELERELLRQRIESLRASTAKDLSESDLFKAQTEQLTVLSGDDANGQVPFELPEGMDIAASGDLPGSIKGWSNAISDYLTLGTPFKEDRDARAKLEVLRSQLMPAFLNTISERGSQWAKEEVERFMLDPDLSDGDFRSRLLQLPNVLRNQLAADRSMLRLGKVGTEGQRGQALRNVIRFPLLIESLEKIIAQDITQGKEFSDEEIDALNKKLGR